MLKKLKTTFQPQMSSKIGENEAGKVKICGFFSTIRVISGNGISL